MKKVLSKSTLHFKGFSLIELLVTVAIIGALSVISAASYRKYLKSAYKTASKIELSDIKKTLNYIYSVDGGYHDRIYSGGYRLPGSIKAWGGFPYETRDIPCDIFPKTADIVSQHSRFFTLNKDVYNMSHVDSSQNSRKVCQNTGCDLVAVWEAGATYHFGVVKDFQKTIGGTVPSDCTNLVKTVAKDYKPDCNTYSYAVISRIPRVHYYMATDQTGVICAGEEGGGWKKQK